MVTKGVLTHAGPFTILFLRLALGTAVLLPFAWRKGYRPGDSVKKEFVLFGLTGMVLHLGFEIVGLRFTSASIAVLIIATAPVVTAALSLSFLNERLSARQGIGLALSLAGVVIITGGQPVSDYPLGWLGSLLVFAGVVTWGIFTVQGKKFAGRHPWLLATTAATGASALLSLPLAASEIAVQGAPQWTAESVTALVYLSVLAQAAAYALWNLALNHVDASVAGPYVNLVPVVGVMLALAVGETMGPLQIFGGLTVATGVWLNHRSG
ncbi:DMT family transporter [soil metagenome]